MVIANGLACRKLGRRIQLIKGNLDFTLIKDGKCGFFDAKSIDQGHFTYSHISKRKHQLDRSVAINERGVQAGFVFYFRPLGTVSFYSGEFIESVGPRGRFTPQSGVSLGSVYDMKLGLLL